MELNEIDLNLFVVFNHLLVERRVSKVADTLGISQPAVSNSLAKLRKLFGDELFLRTPNGMEPTPFADQLAESVSSRAKAPRMAFCIHEPTLEPKAPQYRRRNVGCRKAARAVPGAIVRS